MSIPSDVEFLYDLKAANERTGTPIVLASASGPRGRIVAGAAPKGHHPLRRLMRVGHLLERRTVEGRYTQVAQRLRESVWSSCGAAGKEMIYSMKSFSQGAESGTHTRPDSTIALTALVRETLSPIGLTRKIGNHVSAFNAWRTNDCPPARLARNSLTHAPRLKPQAHHQILSNENWASALSPEKKSSASLARQRQRGNSDCIYLADSKTPK